MNRELQQILLFALLLTPLLAYAEAPRTFPNDVQAFIERRETCDHFRGEFTGGSSPQRDAEVIVEQDKYCKNSDTDLKAIRKKYKKDPKVSEALAKYEDQIESK